MQFSFEDAKAYILANEKVEDILPKAKVSGYICPCCGSGSGKHGTGLSEFKKAGPGVFYCFKEGKVYNIIDLAANANHISWRDAFYALCEKHHIEVEHSYHYQSGGNKQLTKPREMEGRFSHAEVPEQEYITPEEAHREMQEAETHLGETDYLTRRGLSEATQKAFHCGFLKGWYHPKIRDGVKAGKYTFPGTDRVIIPTGEHTYIARAVNDNVKFKKMKVGSGHQFNWDMMLTARKPVMVVEGEIDAMSIYEAGHKETAALGSTAFMNRFFCYIDEHKLAEKPGFALLVALDGDAVGRGKAKDFVQEAKKRHIPVADIGTRILLPETKDANESLVKDRVAFLQKLKQAFREAEPLVRPKTQAEQDERACRHEAERRFAAIQQADGSGNTPQDVFRSFLAQGLRRDIFHYVEEGAKLAKAAGWTQEQIRAGITQTAPEAAYDRLVGRVPYAENVLTAIQQVKSR